MRSCSFLKEFKVSELKILKQNFLGKTLEFAVGPEILGRIYDGIGNPLDNLPPLFSKEKRDVNGFSINPYSREYPSDFVQTGISSIDVLNTLVRGQKLPIFFRR